MYFAHSTAKQDRSDWQTLPAHLHGVGAKAQQRATKFGAPRAGLLAGLAHDLGKYSTDFVRRLAGSKERVDHSTAGAREVMNLPFATTPERRMAELVAYAIAGHHAGLPDRHGGAASLSHRLTSVSIPALDSVWRSEVTLGRPETMPEGFRPRQERERLSFQWSFLGRMIFSALVDADRRNTEEHSEEVGGPKRPRDWPNLAEHVDHLIAALDRHLTGIAKPDGDAELNALRAHILATVTARAEDERGLYTLTVPTGGGKTLTVTRFALAHARKWGLDRIVYAIPFTSVIDQTASILKGIFGEGFILEHHSSIEFASDKEELDFREQGESTDLKLRLAMEDWAAPIVVTTNVQLFESLFSHRPSRCRKLHNLAKSLIILDEAQTIPLRLLRPCLAAIDELARNYGCTVVLCTATQPAVAAPAFRGGLELGPGSELAPDPAGLHDELRRAEIRIAPAPMTDDDLVAALRDVDQGQGFVIVNTRRHALALYRLAKKAKLEGVVHLTTRQYPQHRRAILKRIAERLDPKNPQPCRLIATSLIEAGVDLDFRAGWRAIAGLESIVQAAGRVNREWRYPRADSILTVFTPADEREKPPAEIRALVEAMGRLPGSFWDDPAAPAALREYFQEVYWQRGDAELDRIDVVADGGRQRRSVLGSFRLNGAETDFAYRTVGENFRLIKSDMVPVIVAREAAAQEALDCLSRPDASASSVARTLQPYTVQVPPKARALLVARRDVQFREQARFGDQFAVLEASTLYSDEEGLLWEDDAYLTAEQCTI